MGSAARRPAPSETSRLGVTSRAVFVQVDERRTSSSGPSQAAAAAAGSAAGSEEDELREAEEVRRSGARL